MNNDWISVDQVVLNDGINGAFRPDQIGNAQAAWASNLSITDGKPKSRGFGVVQRAILPKGQVQGIGFFSAQEGMFIVSIWGQLWRILVIGNRVSVDPIPLDFVNSPIIRQVFMCETVGSFLVQDGQSDCIIYDGSVTRRADPLIPEVPRGTRMAFGDGRLAVAQGKNVKVGDIIQNVFQSELKFTETTYLSGGGSFLFRTEVTGLAFLSVNNTATGYGSLMVFGKKYANSLSLQVTSRELWDQMPGFGNVVLPKIGAVSHDSIVAMNQDLYLRDVNGQIWSIRSAAYDAESPGNAPLSREIARVVDFETDTLLPDSGGIFFNNRLLYLASPFYNRFGATSFKYLISLDASPLATIRGKSPPAYEGITEGLNFVKLFQGSPAGVDRSFTISTDDDGENRLWELVSDAKYDSAFLSNGSTNSVSTQVPIQTYYESRRFDWGSPGTLKQLQRLDIWPADLRGPTTITAWWRADNRSQWQLWYTISVDAQMTNNPGQWVDLESQERGRVKSFTCPDSEDVIDQKRTDVGFGFQVRIAWTGYLLLDRIKLWARPLPETAFSEIADLDPDPVQNVVTNNGLSYSIPVGGLGSSYTDQNGNVYVDQYAIPYTTAP